MCLALCVWLGDAVSLSSRTGVLRVVYGPDMPDPVAGDLEREHRYGDAVLRGDQAGLSVDRALQDRQVGCGAGDFGAGARDLLAVFDRALGDRADEAAGVGDDRGAGIQEADEGGDVPGSPRLLKSRTRPACRAAGDAGDCAARTRRGAEEASWRQAAGVRPAMPATSAKG
jgi:hypothetical protein